MRKWLTLLYLFLVLPCAAVFAVVHNSRKKPGQGPTSGAYAAIGAMLTP